MSRLEVRGLSKAFGGKAVLSDVDVAVGEGDIVSVIGPSGCGKTTLLRCILGELRPERGRIKIDDKDVTRTPVWKRRAAIVYQDYALFPHMTVAENVGYGLRIRKEDPMQVGKRVHGLLEMVKLTPHRDKLPRQLSGGQQQRVALARALAIEPRVLLLDEAFTALDSNTRSELVHQVRDIIRQLGVTTLLVTHDQEEAFLFARHVLVLNEGRVVVSGKPEHVMKHPHPFVQEFVRMVLLDRLQVQQNGHGERYVVVRGGARMPLALPGVQPGDEVHVMVKKTPERESVEVWPVEKAP